jgi:hypothetical protein
MLPQVRWGDIKYATNAPDRLQRRQSSLDNLASKMDSERKATKDTLENDKDFVFHKQVHVLFECSAAAFFSQFVIHCCE